MSNIIQFIIGLPSRLLGSILNSDSDWIRYGIPAVVLTAIFFIVMRFEAPTTESPSAQMNADVRKTIRTKPNVFSAPPMPAGNPPEKSDNNPPAVLATESGNEAATKPSGASGTFGQLQTGGSSPEEIAGRQALCNAVRITSKRPSMRRGQMVIGMAIQSYQGPGGAEAAKPAVMKAFSNYKSGAWSDEQCPSPLGTTPLPRGTIAEVMR